MDRAKASIIALWLHIWLKRIAKRYPEFFNQMLDDVKAKVIMRARYINRMKFKQIPDVANVELRQVYKIHQDVINILINL